MGYLTSEPSRSQNCELNLQFGKSLPHLSNRGTPLCCTRPSQHDESLHTVFLNSIIDELNRYFCSVDFFDWCDEPYCVDFVFNIRREGINEGGRISKIELDISRA